MTATLVWFSPYVLCVCVRACACVRVCACVIMAKCEAQKQSTLPGVIFAQT